jgi:hypothetical protein
MTETDSSLRNIVCFFIEDRRWIMSKKFVTSLDVSETSLSPSSDDVDGLQSPKHRVFFFISRIDDE